MRLEPGCHAPVRRWQANLTFMAGKNLITLPRKRTARTWKVLNALEQSMQNLRRLLSSPLQAAFDVSGPAQSSITHFLNATGIKARVAVSFLGLIFICGIGCIDLALAPRLSFDFFYLLGCAIAGWVAGRNV